MAQKDWGAMKHNQVQEAPEVKWKSKNMSQKETANALPQTNLA